MDGARRGARWVRVVGAGPSSPDGEVVFAGRSSFLDGWSGRFARPWTLGRSSLGPHRPLGLLVRPAPGALSALAPGPTGPKALAGATGPGAAAVGPGSHWPAALREGRSWAWARPALLAPLALLDRPVAPVTTVFGVGLDQTLSIPAWVRHSILCVLVLAAAAGPGRLGAAGTYRVPGRLINGGAVSELTFVPIADLPLWPNHAWVNINAGGAGGGSGHHGGQPNGNSGGTSSDGCSVRTGYPDGFGSLSYFGRSWERWRMFHHMPVPAGRAGWRLQAVRYAAVTPETRQSSAGGAGPAWWWWRRWWLDYSGRDSAGGVGQGGYGFHNTSSTKAPLAAVTAMTAT